MELCDESSPHNLDEREKLTVGQTMRCVTQLPLDNSSFYIYIASFFAYFLDCKFQYSSLNSRMTFPKLSPILNTAPNMGRKDVTTMLTQYFWWLPFCYLTEMLLELDCNFADSRLCILYFNACLSHSRSFANARLVHCWCVWPRISCLSVVIMLNVMFLFTVFICAVRHLAPRSGCWSLGCMQKLKFITILVMWVSPTWLCCFCFIHPTKPIIEDWFILPT